MLFRGDIQKVEFWFVGTKNPPPHTTCRGCGLLFRTLYFAQNSLRVNLFIVLKSKIFLNNINKNSLVFVDKVSTILGVLHNVENTNQLYRYSHLERVVYPPGYLNY